MLLQEADRLDNLPLSTQDSYLFLEQVAISLLDEIEQRSAWSILHDNHERLPIHEVVEVSNNVWMLEPLQDVHLIHGRQALLLGQLIHGNLLDDQQTSVHIAAT